LVADPGEIEHFLSSESQQPLSTCSRQILQVPAAIKVINELDHGISITVITELIDQSILLCTPNFLTRVALQIGKQFILRE
jgi:hypothetical protein